MPERVVLTPTPSSFFCSYYQDSRALYSKFVSWELRIYGKTRLHSRDGGVDTGRLAVDSGWHSVESLDGVK